MKKVLIASYDLQVGGVERSLISMLNNFNYNENEVDLMLYSHKGEFMEYINSNVNLLNEKKVYSTFRDSIYNIFKDRYLKIGVGRVLAKAHGNIISKRVKNNSEAVHQLQYMWKYTNKYLPNLEGEYDVAISYLWPHHFVANKVEARKKIAWIHTDYSVIETDVNEDLRIWGKYDHICAVSEECKNSFLRKYPGLKKKVIVIENITSPKFIREMAKEKVDDSINEENSFKLLSVARLSYAKGIDDGVKALKILRDKGFEDIKWYVIGYGGDEEKIQSLIEENNLQGKFVLLGKKINPYPYMKRCNLYVQPSRYEGKAVTVGEAQILGKPVVITNYSTSRSQVNHEFDGYITDMGPKGIADGIEVMYNNEILRRKLSSYCMKKKFENIEELDKLYSLF